jgi:hypothetical protein
LGGGWAWLLNKDFCRCALLMMIDIRLLGWLGCALALLALCKVGFVSGFCVPCNVLKIAWGRVGKVMDVYMFAGCRLG